LECGDLSPLWYAALRRLKELRTDEHIPLIARNHADRILKKIEK